MNFVLESEVATAAEKNDDGKVHPPIAAITFKLEFYDLYPLITSISLASDGSIVTKSNSFFPWQSSSAQ